MKISFFPHKNKNNKYIEIITSILNQIDDVEVAPFETKGAFRGENNICKSNMLWLNWYENHASMPNTILKILVLLFVKIIGIRIIYTYHNKKPHNSGNYYRVLLNIILLVSDKIIIHSRVSKDYIPDYYVEKLVYLPHPNYIGDYGSRIVNDRQNESTNKLKLLFIGAIKPYKNVDLLIEVVNEINDVELTIAGYYVDINYKNYIDNIADSDKIKLKFGFVPDSEIPILISECDLMVMPYDIKSSLNSGTIMLAFSYGKSVISPKIGTLEDMSKDKFFSYSYASNEDHKTELKKTILKAIHFKKNNKTTLAKWGLDMLKEVELKNSKTKIKQIILNQILE